jgi:hypothetical protein
MRTARKIRYRLEWLGLKVATKFVPLLSRKACYRLALLLGSLGAMPWITLKVLRKCRLTFGEMWPSTAR